MQLNLWCYVGLLDRLLFIIQYKFNWYVKIVAWALIQNEDTIFQAQENCKIILLPRWEFQYW